MKRLHIIVIFLAFSIIAHAQNKGVERVYLHLDKSCYIAGEEMWVKMYVVNSDFQASGLSKVGYIEICDTEKPHIQFKLLLDDGKGAGKIRIPLTIPSGVYKLTAYTRYMRNEGADVYFSRQLAIINVGRQSESDRIRLNESANASPSLANPEVSNVRISSDKCRYGKRNPVQINLEGIPQDISDLTLSVYRNDSIAYPNGADKKEWVKNVRSAPTDLQSAKWVPEYEGHIITGRIVPPENEFTNIDPAILRASLGFVGKDIRYFQGRIEPLEGITKFYIADEVCGHQEIVTTVSSADNKSYRLDILSPFDESLPTDLPELPLLPENKRLMDRYVAVQLNQLIAVDSLGNPLPLADYFNIEPHISYDLDEYTRFNTMGETIIEFVRRIIVRKSGDRRVLRVLREDGRQFNSGNTLVLLDGVPLFDHENILEYNPHNIKYIKIYSGKYIFGGETYECMVSFITPRGNLPALQLGSNSQLLEYECPYTDELFKMPAYGNEETKKSLKPDYRHTLYWEPCMENTYQKPVLFYTSDMTGEYKVVVEGITKSGDLVYGTTTFTVY